MPALPTSKSKNILEKSGWSEGKGLGRNEQGDVDSVKVRAKDGVLGIGYTAQVSQVWSTQSVAFADVLSRISGGKSNDNNGNAKNDDDDDDDDEEEEQQRPKATGPARGKHAVLHEKRRRLKTEGLNCASGKNEILASASAGARRQRKDSSSDDSDADSKPKAPVVQSTLKSPLLKRTTERVGAHEPKKRGENDAVVTIKMPDPKPPKCTASPFQYSRE